MIKFTDEGIVTDEAVVIATLKGRGPCLENVETGEWTFRYIEVKEAIQPVEGEACFYWYDRIDEATDKGLYYQPKATYELIHISSANVVKACPLTTGKTVGELRELVGRCEGAAA